jgi:hypothetical protein
MCVDSVDQRDWNVIDYKCNEHCYDRSKKRQLAMDPHRIEGPAVDAQPTTASTNQTIDPDVAETDESSVERHERRLFDDADWAKFSMANERTEHDSAIENDVTAELDPDRQTRPRLGDDDGQRADVDDGQEEADQTAGVTTYKTTGGGGDTTRMHESNVSVKRNGGHVQNTLEYCQVAGDQCVDTRSGAKLPSTDEKGMNVERSNESGMKQIADGQRRDESVRRLPERSIAPD